MINVLRPQNNDYIPQAFVCRKVISLLPSLLSIPNLCMATQYTRPQLDLSASPAIPPTPRTLVLISRKRFSVFAFELNPFLVKRLSVNTHFLHTPESKRKHYQSPSEKALCPSNVQQEVGGVDGRI